MKYFIIITSIAFTLLGSASVHGASIGLYGSSDCSVCNATLPAGGSAQIFIAADGTGDEPFGVDGAEFRVTGLPAGWSAVSTPAPGAVVFGDPFSSGTNIAFGFDQFGTCIQLFTATLSATSAATDVRLRVEMRDPPSHPELPCPWLSFDCPACVPLVCVAGGAMLVNSQLACTVGVGRSTWSHMKALYHDATR